MTIVLDASALLAYIKNESGREVVAPVLDEAAMSSVNWAEVVRKLGAMDEDIDKTLAEIRFLGLAIAPFTVRDAGSTGKLWASTRQYGLSLADRACLSLAMQLDVPVLTADRVWKEIALPVEVQLIR